MLKLYSPMQLLQISATARAISLVQINSKLNSKLYDYLYKKNLFWIFFTSVTWAEGELLVRNIIFAT